VTPHETVDEAIDRVASRMTRSDDGVAVDIPPVWLTRPRPAWLAWRVAGVVGAAAVLLAVAIFWAPRTEDRPVDSPVAASIVVPWSPLRPPVFDSRPGGEAGIRSGVAGARETATVDRQSRPAWGIPFLETPTALAVAGSAMPGIDVDAMVVDALEVVPLSVAAIDPDGTGNSKEQ
jgi:hypothetical protein